MPKQKPLPVRVDFENSTSSFKETKTLANGEAIILTEDGLLEGKTSKNMFTSKYFQLHFPMFSLSY